MEIILYHLPAMMVPEREQQAFVYHSILYPPLYAEMSQTNHTNCPTLGKILEELTQMNI